MEIKGKQKLRELVQKAGIPRLILLVLAGILLLVVSISGRQPTETEEEEVSTGQTEEIALTAMQQYAKKQEQKTEEILSKVEGVGKVKVMLTLASSEEKVTLQNNHITDQDTDEKDQAGGTRKEEKYESEKESVLVQKEGEETPYVVQIQSPSVEGVLVVAQGLDSGKIETEIIEAIQALFPIEPHKIKVMKME
ncbi:MAG: stage III sporulation protein AG [Butyribacter sp.]|nr:stage III sporulation protein AG [bacterium]MDY3854367.1 stage III sporulation protein AG [Butyribacter sp.]